MFSKDASSIQFRRVLWLLLCTLHAPSLYRAILLEDQGSEKGEEIAVWKSLPLLGSFPRSLYLNIFCFSALDEFTYHGIADETLDALTEFFENIGDEYECHKDYDVNLSVSTELNAVFVHGPLRPYLQKDLTLLLEQELGQSRHN